MAGREKFTAAEIIAAIEKAHTAAAAARVLGCNRRRFCNYADRYPTALRLRPGVVRRYDRLAEVSLRKAPATGELWAVAMVLKTIGKNRASPERQEITRAETRARAGISSATWRWLS